MKKNRKKLVIVLLLLFFLVAGFSNSFAQEKNLRIGLSFDVPLFDLRFGFEYGINDFLGIAADVGASAFTLEGNFTITYDVTPVLYVVKSGDGFPVDIDVVCGITDAMLVFSDPISNMWNLGMDLRVSFPVTSNITLGTELGAGYPVFLEGGVLRYGSNYLLGIWPHIEVYGQYGL